MSRSRSSNITIKEALFIFKETGYNYSKTAERTGLYRGTIKKWADSFEGRAILYGHGTQGPRPKLKIRDSKAKPAATDVDLTGVGEVTIVLDKDKFELNLQGLENEIVERMRLAVKCETNMDTLTRALKTVAEVRVINSGGALPDSKTQDNFFLLIHNEISETIANKAISNE